MGKLKKLLLYILLNGIAIGSALIFTKIYLKNLDQMETYTNEVIYAWVAVGVIITILPFLFLKPKYKIPDKELICTQNPGHIL